MSECKYDKDSEPIRLFCTFLVMFDIGLLGFVITFIFRLISFPYDILLGFASMAFLVPSSSALAVFTVPYIKYKLWVRSQRIKVPKMIVRK